MVLALIAYMVYEDRRVLSTWWCVYVRADDGEEHCFGAYTDFTSAARVMARFPEGTSRLQEIRYSRQRGKYPAYPQ